MKRLAPLYYGLWILLLMVGCRSSLSVADLAQPDGVATDTLMIGPQMAQTIDSTLLIDPSVYVGAILDTLVITNHIFDMARAGMLESELTKFYALNDTQIVWLAHKKVSGEMNQLIEVLLDAGVHGLNPVDYNAYALRSELDSLMSQEYPDPVKVAMLDVEASIAYVTYAYHLANGISMPRTKKRLEIARPVEVAPVLAGQPVNKALKQLTPSEASYRYTMEALSRYRELQEKGGWETLPKSTNLRIGDTSAYVVKIAERLKLSGDLDADAVITHLFDSTLRKAVIHFQLRHGLEPDGIMGKSTIAAYNISVNEKVALLELNLDRIRWLPQDLGARYLMVNIPDYTLKAFEDGKQALQMRTIVGKPDSPTPVFRDKVQYIVFSPTWTVPRSIVLNEIIPHQRKDSIWLTDKGYKLYAGWNADEAPLDPVSINWKELDPGSVNYRVVQDPGSDNALGLVKFGMPNPEDIYLHDTPTHYLFTRSKRAFSHGCIRLEHPEQLAVYLLNGHKGWNASNVHRAMNADHPTTVLLEEDIPVYIVYRTAWGGEDGEVQFRSDIYGLDLLSENSRYATVSR